MNVVGSLRDRLRSSMRAQRLVLQVNLLRLRSFRFLEDDVFLAAYPRSGTTLLQMMLHMIVSEGRMDFQHIREISPWWEMNPPSPSRPAGQSGPRTFKTHLLPRQFSRAPARFIYLARDGRDVAVSYYKLHCGYFGYRGDFPSFYRLFLDGSVLFGSWFDHVRLWREEASRGGARILFLKYEDVIADLGGAAGRIGGFLEIPVDESRRKLIETRCSIDYMKQYQTKFGPHSSQAKRNPKDDSHAFIRKGGAGGWQELFTQEMKQAFSLRMQEELPGLYPET